MGTHHGKRRKHYKGKSGKLNAEQRSNVAKWAAQGRAPRNPNKPRRSR